MKPRLAAAALLLVLAACTGRPRVAGPGTPPPRAGQPVVPPPPQTVAPALFALKGELTQGTLLRGTAPEGTALLLLDGSPVRFAADGRFIVGLGRDAAPTALIEARLADGRLLRLPLAISRRGWDISSLPTLQRGGTASGAYKRVRDAELARIAAAKSADADSDGWRQAFRWPAIGRISTLFGSQRIYAHGIAGAPHGGIDIARPTGTPALAPADGIVVLATTDRPFTLEGNLVMIDHGFGLISSMMHLSKIEVHTGDHVAQGQRIGLIGMTGSATGPHLHWGLTWGAARIDPLLVAGPMPER